MYRAGERFVIDRAVCPSFNAWRSQLGLSPIRRVTHWWNQAWCVACLFPAWFAPPQADWPRDLVQTSFPLWDERPEPTLPAELERFLDGGEPPLAFTPGSANVHGGQFFAAAAEACRRMGRRGLLLTRFTDQLPEALPDGVIHVPYAPFSQLLPRCAALVHHGGVGSMSQAMAAGIPQLVVALAHDQFDNGQRVEQLRVGRSIPHRGVTASKLVAAVAPLLASDDVRSAMSSLGWSAGGNLRG